MGVHYHRIHVFIIFIVLVTRWSFILTLCGSRVYFSTPWGILSIGNLNDVRGLLWNETLYIRGVVKKKQVYTY